MGCHLNDGARESLGHSGREACIRGVRIGLDEVEASLLDDPSIEECVVLVRDAETSGPQLVAYVVLAGQLSPERLQTRLQAILPADLLPCAYVPVSNLPLTAAGLVDEQALAQLEVIDVGLVQRWEEHLRSLPDIEQVAVVIQEHTESLPPRHLSDLLPAWNAASPNEIGEPVGVPVPPTAVHEESAPRTRALSHGGPRLEEDGAPTVLSEALRRAALHRPGKGIVYIQADDSEVSQSYEALLAEAERILTGLRDRGIQPQDKVIFQLDLNREFIPAVWGCVLGGFVPVPIPVPPMYIESNSTVQKLRNVWEMLDRPLVLGSRRLVAPIRALSEHLHLENFRVEAIDDLRGYAPDQHWHVSQPDDVALLMLTSGSTGVPKGVMLSHDNILSSVSSMTRMNNLSSQDIALNWMPLDHVGSLVRSMIRDVYLGCQQIQAPTEAGLQDPLKWLDWIERHRATITWAPNFAFGLINDHAETIGQRRWDLSSMRFLLNTGEAIVAKTARRFLELLAPHGLSPNAMHSAWGMSETSSGVTFSDSYVLGPATEDTAFVDVGPPIPGISLRIVDDQNEVVEEDTIGRLQVRGATVTAGYYQRPEINQEVFTDDGWFTTGDLAFLHNGRLTITGREKDVVIINGINYYSHEIEAVVEEIKGVKVSYTAACGVRAPGGETEQLAIFFSPAAANGNGLVDLLKEIRGRVIHKVGAHPHYLIPLEEQDIPKTAIGKIQRSELKQRFEAGEFDAIQKRVDLLSGNANTIPDWFYRKIWRPKAGTPLAPEPQRGQSLVFLDRLGLGECLCAELDQLGPPCVRVETGSGFAKLSSQRYGLDPQDPDHYRRLLASLAEDHLSVDQLFHLWTYDEYAGESSGPKGLEAAQDRGLYSLLFLIQALTQVHGSERPVRVLVIGSHTQPTSPGDEIAYEKTPVLGLIKTLPREMPWLHCHHVDLPVDRVDVNAAHILRELRVAHGDREVAYRNGQRLVARLEKVDFAQEDKQAPPFKRGGIYVLSGGLGGIGVEVAKYLLQQYDARLLLLGRTPLPERSTWESSLEQADVVSERLQAYLSLERLAGEIIYAAVDICDVEQLQQAVDRAKSRWQGEVAGVLHLAGIFQERWLAEETRDSFAATLRPKTLGSWALHQLLKDQPDCLFINFSSLSTLFGGATAGAYAAANSFLESFAYYQRHKRSLRSYCFCWSIWDEVGMSRGYQGKDVLRARGHYAISPKQALNSLTAGLCHDQAHLFVGLDGSNRHIQPHVEMNPHSLRKLRAYFTARSTQVPIARLQALEVQDRFGTRSRCEFQPIPEMPWTATGEVDREKLAVAGQRDLESASTPIEQGIAAIFAAVLGLDQVDIHDSFFALGGSSVQVVQMASRLEKAFPHRDISIVEIFRYPTISSLANYLSGEQDDEAPAFQQSQDRAETRKAMRQQRQSRQNRRAQKL
jgi:acyl-CoA synthetase (AMP-forming)/AMP-acid ligase II/acyl carrier protein